MLCGWERRKQGINSRIVSGKEEVSQLLFNSQPTTTVMASLVVDIKTEFSFAFTNVPSYYGYSEFWTTTFEHDFFLLSSYYFSINSLFTIPMLLVAERRWCSGFIVIFYCHSEEIFWTMCNIWVIQGERCIVMMLCAHNELPEWWYLKIDGKVSLKKAFFKNFYSIARKIKTFTLKCMRRVFNLI